NLLYKTPEIGSGSPWNGTVGETLLRSAATVEQTFGGLTTNLWDDPFEWTLPENLTSPAKIEDYLYEVDRSRERCFASISADDELYKRIALPSGASVELIEVLLAAYGKSCRLQGIAFHAFRMLSGAKLPEI